MDLPEVVQQIRPEAAGGLAVAHHPVQADEIPAEALRVPLLGLLGVGDEVLGGLHVPGGVEQDAAGGTAVAPRPARLLVVAFQVLGHVVVDHKADVGFVDAHAEGVGGHHDPGLVVNKALLAPAALAVLHSGVIPGGGDALGQQGGGNRVHRLPGGAVDDAALLRPLRQKAAEPEVLVPGPDHLKKEVWPVKAGGDAQGVPELQQGFDVPPHRRRGRGGERPHGRPDGQGAHQLRDFQIAGPEVLAPLGDAVGLVHRHQGDGQLPQQAAEALGLEPFRGNV